MSVSVVKCREPRLDIQPDREYVAMVGSSNISTRPYSADTSSSTQLNWNLVTPSVRIGVDRTIWFQSDIRVTVPAIPNDAGDILDRRVINTLDDVMQQVKFGLRQYPLHAAMEVLSLRLNDQQFSWEPANLIHALHQYGTDWQERQWNFGATAHYPDKYWSYDVNASAKNPFGRDTGTGGMEDRRSFESYLLRVDDIGQSNTNAGAAPLRNGVFTVRLVEPIFISPLTWGEEVQCLFGIQNIDLSLTLVGDTLRRLFAGDPIGDTAVPTNSLINNDNGLTDAQRAAAWNTATFVWEDPVLRISYLQPQADHVIPPVLNYPYYAIRRLNQQQTALNGIAGVGDPILNNPTSSPDPQGRIAALFNNVSLHEIPKRMYIYAKPLIQSGESRLASTNRPDYYMAIERISINFDTQDSRMATLNNFDLWKLSTKNGLKRSFNDWRYKIGSVLCLEFGTDLNLNPLLVPGTRGNFQLSMEVTFRDPRSARRIVGDDSLDTEATAPLNYTMHLILVPEGLVTIENQLVTVSIGALTEQLVLDAPFADPGTRRQIKDMYGGSIWSKIGKVFKNVVAPVARDVMGVASDVLASAPHPGLQALAIPAKFSSKLIEKGLSGNGRRAGGRRVRTSSLANRM